MNLGELDGCEVFTITNNMTGNYNDPAESYLETLRRGIRENYPETADDAINRYIERCKR